MNRSISSIFLLVLLITGCSESTVAPGDGNYRIPFELVVPQVPAADYFGISGIRVTTNEVIIDTLSQGTLRDLYVEFYRTGAVPLPATIQLNGTALARSANTDTFRLRSGGLSLYGIHTWRLTDSLGARDSFSIAPVDLIDTVSPLYLQPAIRPDTSLTITWRSPSSATNGVLLTWRMAGAETWQNIVVDNGRATIPASVVSRFRGRTGELILTRFHLQRSTTSTGRSIQLVRVAQRNYKTLVIG